MFNGIFLQKYNAEMASYEGSEVKTNNAGQKRKLDANNVNNNLNETNFKPPNTNSNKRTVQEGYSWWTCLTMGMPVENSRPHSVPKMPQGK